MKKSGVFMILAALFGAAVVTTEFNLFPAPPKAPVQPNWEAIAAWPPDQADTVDAVPDPNRSFTAIVLDDSGSMGSEIGDAKTAVVSALSEMAPKDRLTVIGLNSREIIPFMTVEEAQGVLPGRLADVISDGGTPLTRAVQASRQALAQEAAVAGGFGTYRILVTTDGQAADAVALEVEIEDIAANTPIQVATIGVGIKGGHVLRRSDLAVFVAIDNVGQLADALRRAIAEEQSFSATTSFGDQ